MSQRKSEDAVSPVIGVMLLLVVTIVIAAVVAAFAGGLGTDIETKPVTAVDIVDVSDGYSEFVQTVGIKSGNAYGKTFLSYEGDDGWSYIFKIDASKYVSEKPDGEMGKDYFEYTKTQYIPGQGLVTQTQYYIPDEGEIESSVFYREKTNEETWTIEREGYGDTSLQNEFLEEVKEENWIDERTVTLSCLHGDALDLSKISIKVTYNARWGEYIIDTPRNSFTGTLSPGDTKKLLLNPEDDDIWNIYEGCIVSVVVYYGDYVIAEEKEMTVSHDYR